MGFLCDATFEVTLLSTTFKGKQPLYPLDWIANRIFQRINLFMNEFDNSNRCIYRHGAIDMHVNVDMIFLMIIKIYHPAALTVYRVSEVCCTANNPERRRNFIGFQVFFIERLLDYFCFVSRPKSEDKDSSASLENFSINLQACRCPVELMSQMVTALHSDTA